MEKEKKEKETPGPLELTESYNHTRNGQFGGPPHGSGERGGKGLTLIGCRVARESSIRPCALAIYTYPSLKTTQNLTDPGNPHKLLICIEIAGR